MKKIASQRQHIYLFGLVEIGCYEHHTGRVAGSTSPVLTGIHSEIHSGFPLCSSAGSSQPLAGFYSTPVLISLRWHGGEADLIIVMVAGGSSQ